MMSPESYGSTPGFVIYGILQIHMYPPGGVTSESGDDGDSGDDGGEFLLDSSRGRFEGSIFDFLISLVDEH
eukprot:SAG22_NODE_2862_length_2149_cov_2.649268_2_plen_71_part_00